MGLSTFRCACKRHMAMDLLQLQATDPDPFAR